MEAVFAPFQGHSCAPVVPCFLVPSGLPSSSTQTSAQPETQVHHSRVPGNRKMLTVGAHFTEGLVATWVSTHLPRLGSVLGYGEARHKDVLLIGRLLENPAT